ncbi:MAG TPA: GAF domain-containing sensor histidine kinase [Bryobacteraceae bacterium]|nr:GAF domain-containing sensor histidine kinase [Bryobacteraceae bacterium]
MQRLAVWAGPYAARLDRKFLCRLRTLGFEARQRSALLAITPGAALRLLRQRRPLLKFIEQVEYNGRRLAKLNLPPSAVLKALKEYNRLWIAHLERPASAGNLRWVREQLHFCVTLTLNNAYYQVREAETQSFYEQFRIELESRNLEELLRRFLESLIKASRADAGRLYMLNEEQSAWTRKAKWPHEDSSPSDDASDSIPAPAPLRKRISKPQCVLLGSPDSHERSASLALDPAWARRFQSCWSIPLATGGRVAGVMQLVFRKPYEWLPREKELLGAAAERCLMAAEKQRLMEDLARREEQVRRLAEHMLHVEEIERRRISRELHDEAGQSLLCIRLQMEMLERSVPADSEAGRREWIAKLCEVRDLTERTILEMRRLIAALSPAVLEQLGLAAALRQLLSRFRRVHPCRLKLQMSKLEALPPQSQIIVYRLVQECCNNIGKHSGASQVNISLHFTDGILRLCVQDNGAGFDVREALSRHGSFGLSGMQERVALLGGRFQVKSRTQGPKMGTKISVELPISL